MTIEGLLLIIIDAR